MCILGILGILALHCSQIKLQLTAVTDANIPFPQQLLLWSTFVWSHSRYCGSSFPSLITSTNNALTVVFQSDSSVAMEGFSATYITQNATTGENTFSLLEGNVGNLTEMENVMQWFSDESHRSKGWLQLSLLRCPCWNVNAHHCCKFFFKFYIYFFFLCWPPFYAFKHSRHFKIFRSVYVE